VRQTLKKYTVDQDLYLGICILLFRSDVVKLTAEWDADSLKICCTFGLFDDFIGEIPF
jgi:hypothetical protein